MQTVDPSVSREKFQIELDKYLSSEENYRRRGILLLKAVFPEIILLFSSLKLTPRPIVFAVKINFENYDLEALSVRFIDPFTWDNLEIPPVSLFRKINGQAKPAEFVQKDHTGLPFICMPGIREYHNHPAHSGDPWLLHRNRGGEGSLGFILEKLYEYGISAIHAYQLQIQTPQIMLIYDINSIPE